MTFLLSFHHKFWLFDYIYRDFKNWKLYYTEEFVLYSTNLNSYYTGDCTKWNCTVLTPCIYNFLITLRKNRCRRVYSSTLKTQGILFRLTTFQGIKFTIQAFLDFHGFDFRYFRFNAVYNSIISSSPFVVLCNLDLCGFCFCGFLFVSPH